MIYLDSSVALAQLLAEDRFPPDILWDQPLLVNALQRGGRASRTKSQSPSPDLLAPEGINCLLPSLANGDPFTSAYSPLVGSYQRTVVVPVSFDISTVMARIVGM